jgi:hypothetical protein
MKLPFIYKDGRIEMHFVDRLRPTQLIYQPKPFSLEAPANTDSHLPTLDTTLFYLYALGDNRYEYREA